MWHALKSEWSVVRIAAGSRVLSFLQNVPTDTAAHLASCSVGIGNSLCDCFFTRKVDLNLKRNVVKCYIWRTALCGAKTWTLLNVYQKYFESFEMWWWKRKEKIVWMYRVQNAVLLTVKEEMNILQAIQRSIGHILSSNCFIKHVIEGKVG